MKAKQIGASTEVSGGELERLRESKGGSDPRTWAVRKTMMSRERILKMNPSLSEEDLDKSGVRLMDCRLITSVIAAELAMEISALQNCLQRKALNSAKTSRRSFEKASDRHGTDSCGRTRATLG
jgi:hypothetical protein